MKKIMYSIALTFLALTASIAQNIYIRTVVHVLYTNTADNISDATVLNYVNEVNKGYAKQHTPVFTRATSIFDTLWANTEIQLCLASLDPSGNPTTGITHTSITDKFSPGQNPSTPAWNPTYYLNIYITPVYNEPGYPNFVVGGWASTPTNPQMGATFNYVVVASNSITFIPELLTHEIGHVFGLDHLSSDAIDDTPAGMESINLAAGYSATCSSTLQFSNTTTLAQDGMHWGGVDPPDMVENFMGLSFCCSYMFTNDQKNAMRSYIQTHISNWITSGCITTSVTDTLSVSNNISVFPNPASQTFTIASNINNLKTIKIIDLVGKEIKTIPLLQNKKIIIERGVIQTGIYFLQITDEYNNMAIRKIMID